MNDDMIKEFRLRRVKGVGIVVSIIYIDGMVKKFDFPNWLTAYSMLDALG